MVEFKKFAKTLNQLQNKLPEIIRTSEKIDETIQANVDAQYKSLYVPMSKIDLAKKDLQNRLEKTNPYHKIATYEEWVDYWFGE